MEYEQFDRRLARECAKAFSQSTGLGCTLSDKTGRAFDEYGYGCESCGMCAAAGASHDRCVQAHIYGMTEAERFGGKYIYFCPMGLTCFVSPILGEGGAEAKITVGPFIMVEKQDFIACELTENVRLTEAQKQAAVQVLENIPFVPTERVTQLSVLLFMAVGFMNNVSAENRMMESGHSEELQGQIHRAELSAETAGTLAEETVTRLEALRGQAKDKDENLSRLREELAGHKAFAEELQERLQSLQNSKNGYLYKLKSRSDKQAEAESRQRNSEKLAGEKLQRAQVLSDLEKNYESFNNSVKFVMKQAGAGALRGIVGPVSSLIKTENRYSTAV